jgi:hypothetical protein
MVAGAAEEAPAGICTAPTAAARCGQPRGGRYAAGYRRDVAGELDIDAMIERFRKRAAAVRNRGIPPVEGAERRRFLEQAQQDYMDFAIIGDAKGHLENGILTLTVDLRREEG